MRASAPLHPLVLHGGTFSGAALSAVLPARRGLRQTLAEVLRQSPAPGLPLQGACRCQGRSGGDSGKNWGRLGQAGFMMASCRGGRTPETFWGPMVDRQTLRWQRRNQRGYVPPTMPALPLPSPPPIHCWRSSNHGTYSQGFRLDAAPSVIVRHLKRSVATLHRLARKKTKNKKLAYFTILFFTSADENYEDAVAVVFRCQKAQKPLYVHAFWLQVKMLTICVTTVSGIGVFL